MKKRFSWTTKTSRARIFETEAEAYQVAHALLGHERTLFGHIMWASSEHGFVFYREDGKKMLADG